MGVMTTMYPTRKNKKLQRGKIIALIPVALEDLVLILIIPALLSLMTRSPDKVLYGLESTLLRKSSESSA